MQGNSEVERVRPRDRWRVMTRPVSHLVLTIVCVLAAVWCVVRLVVSGSDPAPVEAYVGWVPLVVLAFLVAHWSNEAFPGYRDL